MVEWCLTFRKIVVPLSSKARQPEKNEGTTVLRNPRNLSPVSTVSRPKRHDGSISASPLRQPELSVPQVR